MTCLTRAQILADLGQQGEPQWGGGANMDKMRLTPVRVILHSSSEGTGCENLVRALSRALMRNDKKKIEFLLKTCWKLVPGNITFQENVLFKYHANNKHYQKVGDCKDQRIFDEVSGYRSFIGKKSKRNIITNIFFATLGI